MKDSFNPEAFCRELSGILHVYKDVKLKKSDIKSFEEVKDKVNELDKKLIK